MLIKIHKITIIKLIIVQLYSFKKYYFSYNKIKKVILPINLIIILKIVFNLLITFKGIKGILTII
jgi:hypothetical protein